MNDEPSLPEQAKNITKTAYDIVKGFVFNGMLIVPDEVKKARIDICSCLLYTSDAADES
mgnify:CR=1 FL=1